MSSACKNINPLKRSGVNQYQRVMNALLPSFVQVDERDDADLILFAKNYAGQLTYYNADNNAEGTWGDLMGMDVSVTLASLIKTDVKGCFAYVKDILDAIRETTSEAEAKDYFKALFDFGFSLITLLDRYYNALPADFSYRETLGNSIRSNFPVYLGRMITYYDLAKDPAAPLIDENSAYTFPDPPVQLILSQDLNVTTITGIWAINPPPLPSWFTPAFNGTTGILKIKNTATHNLFTGIFDVFLKSLAGIVEKAKDNLEITFTGFPAHSPHYALYLTFIKLFRYAQDSMNTFTGNHLDLYYKEILQLQNKPAEADKVHLTFELQKNISQHLLKKDTVFKAGKDTDGEEIFYALAEDIIINKGAVKSLKNIFVKKDTSAGTKQIFAAPVANSQDGAGAKLESPDKSWKPFGSDEVPAAQTGFAIASNYLYLREGARTIWLNFQAVSEVSFSVAEITGKFDLQLTGEKGWIDVTAPLNFVIDSSKTSFSISFTLDAGAGAVVPYSEKIHQQNYKVALPVAKFLLRNTPVKETLWNFQFSKIDILTIAIGLKDISIQNDAGTLSTTKPFDLFGSSPHAGSSFIIGNKELFIKAMQPSANFILPSGKIWGFISFTWDNYQELNTKKNTAISDTDATTVIQRQVDILYLAESSWKALTENKNESLFGFLPADAKTSLLQFFIEQFDLVPDYSKNENLTVDDKWGFLRIDLNQEFGHSTYNARLNSAILTNIHNALDENASTGPVSLPAEPYTPKVKEVSLHYIASSALDFAATDEARFIHITPFGNDSFSSAKKPSALLPSFNNEGELFIGIENLAPGQTLSILFQVAEGTADPLATKQEITWYYLAGGNGWIEFDKQDIADSTDDLSNSGIIKFNTANDAVTQNTIMGDQLHWIKATVPEKTNAVCKLITVTAQAAVAKFYDYRSTGNYFKNTLPAGSVSKLVATDAAIKKITQPYASFNGRTNETDEHFYIRVSERLRHKSRSITIWDYERMVLEQFTEVFKVKCINHTQILEQTSAGSTVYIDNEAKPGYVLVIPIPDLQNKNAYDPLRPNTSLGLLTGIKKYLYGYISPHVNLDVRNPRFEEIQLAFKVRFITGDNDFYKLQLKEEIEQYLAPWAYDQSTDIEFGGKISKSTLIDFIEERPYVDFLSCVNMYTIVDSVKSPNVEEAMATSARSVFVSVKSDDPLHAHDITFITDECEC